ncbi:MAG: hypothetical protein Q9162_006630 [Coniocarpon cinnabarinum]
MSNSKSEGKDTASAPPGRPSYMTVGSNAPSESASKLQALIDNDSGYGSLADGFAEHMEDRPIPRGSEGQRAVASHVHQLHYNHNRTALGRAITRTLDSLRRLQEYNQQWPAHYPTTQPPPRSLPSHIETRPGIQHTQSHGVQRSPRSPVSSTTRPLPPRRAETFAGDDQENAESSRQASQASIPEPRLVTPQLARDFSVLKIDLKMDGLAQTEIIHSMRKDSKALAQLLDGQISKSVRHLSLLRDRIEDTSSKVLVTGDLNAGKSTFCNALLRRKILPEDDQPCTSIFCEVLDVGFNGGVEEVHAIPLGSTYDRNDERTYDVFPLSKLERIVIDNGHYGQCKVYIRDVRNVEESLLNNGVLDIALIDAPGLNSDSIKTTAVFARQEEIDVVVFVVHAMNHFTQSAQEFIFNAAREKEYMFMVVNNFNTVKNKDRCQELILKQLTNLSPATFKESEDLVHFVSSNVVPVSSVGDVEAPGGSSSGSASGGSGPSGDPGDDDDDDDPSDKGKGKQREQMRDFEVLEASLRRFVLEKRARTKLAPARTYLLNLLEDIRSLAMVNRDMAQAELDRVAREIHELEPVLDKSKHARNDASDSLDQVSEDTATDIYDHTRNTLNETISDVSQRDLGVVYPGLFDAYHFADDVVSAMLDEVSLTVNTCEEYARVKTGEGCNAIRNLGLLHLGDVYEPLIFQGDKMLRRRKDALARQVDVEIDFWDFFDFASLWDRQEKVAGTGMAVTVAGVLGTRMVGGAGWVDGALGMAKVLGTRGMGRLVVPCLIGSVVFAISYAVSAIPQSLPRRLSQKVATQLSAIDFVHANSLRISSEARRALKIPADNLRVGLQRNLEQLQTKREETGKIRTESEVAKKYFSNLVRESTEVRGAVQRVDLEGPAMNDPALQEAVEV